MENLIRKAIGSKGHELIFLTFLGHQDLRKILVCAQVHHRITTFPDVCKVRFGDIEPFIEERTRGASGERIYLFWLHLNEPLRDVEGVMNMLKRKISSLVANGKL